VSFNYLDDGVGYEGFEVRLFILVSCPDIYLEMHCDAERTNVPHKEEASSSAAPHIFGHGAVQTMLGKDSA